MVHVLSSETGMTFSWLLVIEDHDDRPYIDVCWRGLPNSEDSVESLQKIYEDVRGMVNRFLNRKNTLPDLVEKACTALALKKREGHPVVRSFDYTG